MYLLRCYAQLARNLRQGKDAADRLLVTRRSFDRFNRQRMLTAGKSQRGNHVSHTSPLQLVEVEDFQSIRWRHDIAYDNLAVSHTAFLRKLYRSFAQDVGGRNDPEYLAS